MKLVVTTAAIATLLASALAAAGGMVVSQPLTLATGSALTVPAPAISPGAGSFTAWIKPLWPADDRRSHTFFTLPWKGEGGYMALSLGWWEPAGAETLYFILGNRDYAFCLMSDEFRYQIFVPGLWTLVAATWSRADGGRLRLYVDGHQVCQRVVQQPSWSAARDRLYLGSDLGATDQRGRAADFALRELEFFDQELTASAIADRYFAGGGEPYRKWLRAAAGDAPLPAAAIEPRIMYDEDAHWVDSRAEIDRVIARLRRAGINTYVPCVWEGSEALFTTSLAPMAGRYRRQLALGFDALAYLIAAAHKADIAVVLWFEVARRPGGTWPAEYTAGAPPGAFNVHSTKFSDFTAGLIGDAAQRYAPDGINLDYIRSMGICDSARCAADYRAHYRRELRSDQLQLERGVAVPTLAAWNAMAVGNIVAAVAGRLESLTPRPRLSITTAPFGAARLHEGVDVMAWLQRGLIDAVVYMAYEEPLEVARVMQAWQRIPRGKLVVLARDFDLLDGRARPYSGAQAVDLVRLVRRLWPDSGIGFYHYPHFSAAQADALGAQVFASPAGNSWRIPECDRC